MFDRSASWGIAIDIRELDIFKLENKVWLATRNIGVPTYDYMFEPMFACRRPYEFPGNSRIICRIGAFDDYADSLSKFEEVGFHLVNNLEEHLRATQLSKWYPLIEEFTPRSRWYKEIPEVEEIESSFDYPVFIKGTRQTAKHNKELCVATNRQECIHILKEYRRNPILHWQQLVCREFVRLKPIVAVASEKVAPSFEFRSFWLDGSLVGSGHYWSEFASYSWSKEQRVEALALAKKVCLLVAVPFLVIDLALTDKGDWIVIECNDGQESGYSGVSSISLWKKVLEVCSDVHI